MFDPNKSYIYVNDKRVSVAAFLAMDKMTVTIVDASDCTGLTALDLPNATTVYARRCTGLTALDLPNATTVDASDCTGLTALDLPNATTVYARRCTGLTALDLPNATTVDASDCTGLTAPWFYAGSDFRGYGFLGDFRGDVLRVRAGCRNFTIPAARKYWGPGGRSDRPDCLALVEKIAAHDFGADSNPAEVAP